jgi:hypothetical protein
MRIGSDSPTERAWHIVEGLAVEWPYESERKEAIAKIARALEEFYEKGRERGAQND